MKIVALEAGGSGNGKSIHFALLLLSFLSLAILAASIDPIHAQTATSNLGVNAQSNMGATTSPFVMNAPLGWAEVSAAFAPSSSAIPITVTQSCQIGVTNGIASCSLPSSTEAGDLIVVEVSEVPPVTISDSAGNAYTEIASVSLPTSTYYAATYYTVVSSGGPDTITVTGQANTPSIIVQELKGATTTFTFATGSGISSTPDVSSYAPATDSFILAGMLSRNAGETISAGSGYTLLGLLPVPALADEYAYSGTAISGYYTLLYQNGGVVATGFAPTTFTLNDGQMYIVQVDDYGSCHFDHWSDTGSTSASRVISITSDTQLTAVYNCGGGSSASSVTVNSVDQNGDAIFGYYTALSQGGGSTVATGFTTKTFSTTAGQAYQVQVDNYGSCTFSHWSDGVTSDPRAVTATSGPTSLTAVYSCGGTSTTSTIDVSTVNGAGASISGYYITLWQNGQQLQSCFSACSFTVNGGQTYQVMASSYGSETFNHWQNDGATGFETVDVLGTGTTVSLTAIYTP